jgi:hypothetical protein
MKKLKKEKSSTENLSRAKQWSNLEDIKGLFKQKFNTKQKLNNFIIWTKHDANLVWNELRVQRHNLHCWN